MLRVSRVETVECGTNEAVIEMDISFSVSNLAVIAVVVKLSVRVSAVRAIPSHFHRWMVREGLMSLFDEKS